MGYTLNGSSQAEQPNANWRTLDPVADSNQYSNFYTELKNNLGPVVDWAKLGYTGPQQSVIASGNLGADGDGQGMGTGSVMPSADQAFQDFITKNGYGELAGKNEQGFNLRQLTQNGKPIAGASVSYSDPDPQFYSIIKGITDAGLLYGGYQAAAGTGASGSTAATGGSENLAAQGLTEAQQYQQILQQVADGTLKTSGLDVAGLTGLDSAAYAAAGDGFLTGAGGLGNAPAASTGVTQTVLDKLASGNYLDAIKAGGSGLVDWVTKNPGTALQLGSLLGGAVAGSVAGGSKGSGAAGSGSGSSYVPNTLSQGNFQAQVTPQYKQIPAQAQGLLANPQQGQANDGLWRYNKTGLLG